MKPLVIKRAPKTRAPKIGKFNIVARVMADTYVSSSGQYRHPTLELGVMLPGYDGSEPRFEAAAEVKFQQHRLDRRDLVSVGEQPRGLLSLKGWSGAYGATVSARCEYGTDRKKLRRVLDLIDALDEVKSARWYASTEAQQKSGKRHGALRCELLAMIVALRHAGVEVSVWRPAPERRTQGGYGSLAVTQ